MPITDLHSHILPGVDDGPTTSAGSLALADAFTTAGVQRLVATPHVSQRWGVRITALEEQFALLRHQLTDEGIPLELVFGAEVQLSTAIDLDDGSLDRLRLGGGEWLLIEPPDSGPPASVHGMLFEIQSRGYRVLLAHPERSRFFQEDPNLLASLVAGGLRTQVTADALTGGFGRSAERYAKDLLRRDLVHTVASDAHHATSRPPGMSDQLSRAGYGWQIEWLCEQMPEMFLEGGEEPPRPERVNVHRSIWDRMRGR